MALTNGTIRAAPSSTSEPSTVIGINLGNSFASISVITKKGLAECIANEDGERQIASAISFFGEEVYVGNQARPQLVKNAINTIVGFRNLLGKKFSDIKDSDRSSGPSAPIIEDPETGLPAYKVTVLVPAPAPLTPTPTASHAASTLVSRATTPAVSKAPTPRSEPTPQERILTVNDVMTMFLKSLLRTAEDFLGELVEGAVISVPSWFDNSARDTLVECARNADLKVLQLLDDAGAAAALMTEPLESSNEIEDTSSLPGDRNSLLIDLGASSLTLTLLALRSGLPYVLASSTTPTLGGNTIDDRLVAYFAKEFTKKSKVPFNVSSSTASEADKRAEAKLRLAVEFTKRTLSASTTTGSGAASCSVESLKDGVDFTANINRLRFDLEMRSVYAAVLDRIDALLKECGKDHLMVDELVFIGGSAALPGLQESIILAFPENVKSGNYGEETSQVLSKGCAYQARLISSILPPSASGSTEGLEKAFDRMSNLVHTSATSKTIGVHFVGSSAGEKLVLPIIQADTPLPVRRSATLEINVPEGASEETPIGVEVWEALDEVKVERVEPPPKYKREDDEAEEDQDEDEDEDEEPEETRSKILTPQTHLASLTFRAKSKGRLSVTVELHLESNGSLTASAWETGWQDGRGVVEFNSTL